MKLDADQLLQPASLMWAHIRPPSADEAQPAELSSSSDESSSTSTASSQGSAGTVPDESRPADVAWICQRARRHIVREYVEDRPVPWCRDTAFVQDSSDSGSGLARSASPEPPCPFANVFLSSRLGKKPSRSSGCACCCCFALSCK